MSIEKTRYEGCILGFNYRYEADTKEEFESILESELRKYIFRDLELKLLFKILGLDDILNRLTKLEGVN